MKIAVIGVGRMGRRHIHAVHALGHEVAAVCDSNEEALAATQAECGITQDKQFRDAALMLETVLPDGVIIATTAPAHAALTGLVAEAGVKAILCEKPMATSLAECDQMVTTCRQQGAKLAINHYMRFIDLGVKLRENLESDAFGGLTSMTVAAGNIGLAMVGTHYLELFRFLIGEPLVEVTGWLEENPLPNPRGPQFFDRAGSIRAVSAGGKRFYLEAGVEQGHGVKIVCSGPNGQLVVDPFSGLVNLSVRQEQNRTLPSTRYVTPSLDTTINIAPVDTAVGAQHVLKALLEETPTYTAGEDAREIIAALVAAYVSSENGNRTIRVDDALPANRQFPWA